MSRVIISKVDSIVAISILLKVYISYLYIRVNLVRLKKSLDLVLSLFIIIFRRYIAKSSYKGI